MWITDQLRECSTSNINLLHVCTFSLYILIYWSFYHFFMCAQVCFVKKSKPVLYEYRTHVLLYREVAFGNSDISKSITTWNYRGACEVPPFWKMSSVGSSKLFYFLNIDERNKSKLHFIVLVLYLVSPYIFTNTS